MTTVALKPATMAQALERALRDAMAADPSVHVMGEDVGTLGGVFRVTDGLAKEFGEDRCTDTPLAEAGILGAAVGMAMYGLRPVVEMQFDAFAYPAFEQLDLAMWPRCATAPGARMPLPITIRVPYGGGIGGVEHHSDSSEAYYWPPRGCTSSRPRRSPTPTGCCARPSPPTTRWSSWSPSGCTGRRTTGRRTSRRPVEPIGRAVVRRSGRSATLITYGPSVPGLPGGRRGGAGRGLGPGRRRPALPGAVRRRDGLRPRYGGPGARSSSTSRAASAGRARRSPRGSPSAASTTWRRRCCG